MYVLLVGLCRLKGWNMSVKGLEYDGLEIEGEINNAPCFWVFNSLCNQSLRREIMKNTLSVKKEVGRESD